MTSYRRVVAAISGLFLACATLATTTLAPGAEAADPFTVWTVGDICDDDNEAVDCADVGDLVAADSPDYFVPLGDNQYEIGSLSAFNTYYHPKVGSKLNQVTRPAVGNHEYRTANAAGYFSYFGAAAGDPAKGYYSWTAGNWKLIVLNSNCAKINRVCGYGKAEALWLRDQLAGPETCEVVFDHHPPITDGEYAPGTTSVRGFWRRAYEGRAELFVSGHDHGYQRFAPRRTDFSLASDGVRALVVGTGGKSLYPFTATNRSEYRQTTSYGALRLTLTDTGYSGDFVSVSGVTMDSFSGTCR
jgi:hypothetical protein